MLHFGGSLHCIHIHTLDRWVDEILPRWRVELLVLIFRLGSWGWWCRIGREGGAVDKSFSSVFEIRMVKQGEELVLFVCFCALFRRSGGSSSGGTDHIELKCMSGIRSHLSISP